MFLKCYIFVYESKRTAHHTILLPHITLQDKQQELLFLLPFHLLNYLDTTVPVLKNLLFCFTARLTT